VRRVRYGDESELPTREKFIIELATLANQRKEEANCNPDF